MNYKSYLASDSDKIDSKNKNLIFDRIINLKIYTGQKNKSGIEEVTDSFVIRSDFELASDYGAKDILKPKTGTKRHFRKCLYKPSIKVQYKQVTSSTNIAIDIFISNFFMYDSNGNCLSNFNSDDKSLVQVECTMGYFNQFAELFDPEEATMEDFLTLKTSDSIDKFVMRNVEYSVIDKLPPDYTLHIHGYVSNVSGEATDSNKTRTTFESASKSPLFMDISGQKYDEIFFNCITRRFLRDSVIDKTRKGEMAGVIKYLYLDEYGLMTKEIAREYGVKIRLSPKVEALSVQKKEGEEENKLSLDEGRTVQNTLNCLCRELNSNIRFTPMSDGSYFVFLNDELDAEGMKNIYENNIKGIENSVSKRDNIIPAVTNINVSAISTITCPFFGFVEPFQLVKFKSKYSLTNLITYYVGNEKSYEFYVMNMSVSFATVENINEMLIKAVTENHKEK